MVAPACAGILGVGSFMNGFTSVTTLDFLKIGNSLILKYESAKDSPLPKYRKRSEGGNP